MGFFSKVWKGIKTGVKGVVKGVKKAVKSIGKFMNKIGVLGNIALMFILPGSGLMANMGAWTKAMTTYSGFGSTVVNAAGKFLTAATRVGNAMTKPFRTITSGVMDVVKNTVGAIANKIPGMTDLVKNLSNNKINLGDYSFKNAFDAVGKTLTQTAADVGTIFNPGKWELPESFAKGYYKDEYEAIKTSIQEGGLGGLTTEQRTLYDQAAKQGINLGDTQLRDSNIIDINEKVPDISTIEDAQRLQQQRLTGTIPPESIPVGTATPTFEVFDPSTVPTRESFGNKYVSWEKTEKLRDQWIADEQARIQAANMAEQARVDALNLSVKDQYIQDNISNKAALEEQSLLAQPDVYGESAATSTKGEETAASFGSGIIDSGIREIKDKGKELAQRPISTISSLLRSTAEVEEEDFGYGWTPPPSTGEMQAAVSRTSWQQQMPSALNYLGQQQSMTGLYAPFLVEGFWADRQANA